MVLEKSCGATVYSVENEKIKCLIVEEASCFHSFPKGHMENEETFRDVINYLIPELGIKLAGAVCDFTEPAAGQSKLFFPVA